MKGKIDRKQWLVVMGLAVAVLVILTRLWPVRSLEMPMLGDSYQHSMITQLLLDNGGLFDSWQPYAELSTFTYHFGFHAAAAAFAWISRLPAPQAMQAVGRVQCMPSFVPEDSQAPILRATLDLQHLRLLEPGEPRVGEVERDRDPGEAVRAEPLVGEPEVGPEAQRPLAQLAPHLPQERLDEAAADPQAEVAHPDVEEALVVPGLPLRGGGAPCLGRRRCGGFRGRHHAVLRALTAPPLAPGR